MTTYHAILDADRGQILTHKGRPILFDDSNAALQTAQQKMEQLNHAVALVPVFFGSQKEGVLYSDLCKERSKIIVFQGLSNLKISK